MSQLEMTVLNELKNSVDNLDKRLEKIELALIGDPDLGNEGFTKRLRNVEQEQIVLKSTLDRILWIASGAGLVFGVVGQLIFSLF